MGEKKKENLRDVKAGKKSSIVPSKNVIKVEKKALRIHTAIVRLLHGCCCWNNFYSLRIAIKGWYSGSFNWNEFDKAQDPPVGFWLLCNVFCFPLRIDQCSFPVKSVTKSCSVSYEWRRNNFYTHATFFFINDHTIFFSSHFPSFRRLQSFLFTPLAHEEKEIIRNFRPSDWRSRH